MTTEQKKTEVKIPTPNSQGRRLSLAEIVGIPPLSFMVKSTPDPAPNPTSDPPIVFFENDPRMEWLVTYMGSDKKRVVSRVNILIQSGKLGKDFDRTEFLGLVRKTIQDPTSAPGLQGTWFSEAARRDSFRKVKTSEIRDIRGRKPAELLRKQFVKVLLDRKERASQKIFDVIQEYLNDEADVYAGEKARPYFEDYTLRQIRDDIAYVDDGKLDSYLKVATPNENRTEIREFKNWLCSKSKH